MPSENGCKINKIDLCLTFSAKNRTQNIWHKVKIGVIDLLLNFISQDQFQSEDLAVDDSAPDYFNSKIVSLVTGRNPQASGCKILLNVG